MCSQQTKTRNFAQSLILEKCNLHLKKLSSTSCLAAAGNPISRKDSLCALGFGMERPLHPLFVNNAQQVDYLETLPNELLVQILGYLDAASLISIATVNSYWKWLVQTNDSLLWAHVLEVDFPASSPYIVQDWPQLLLEKKSKIIPHPADRSQGITPPLGIQVALLFFSHITNGLSVEHTSRGY